jgi:hypothetical protein
VVIDQNAGDPVGRYNVLLAAADYDQALQDDDDIRVALTITMPDGEVRPHTLMFDVYDKNADAKIEIVLIGTESIQAGLNEGGGDFMQPLHFRVLKKDRTFYDDTEIASIQALDMILIRTDLNNLLKLQEANQVDPAAWNYSVNLEGWIVSSQDKATGLQNEFPPIDVFLKHGRIVTFRVEAVIAGEVHSKQISLPVVERVKRGAIVL